MQHQKTTEVLLTWWNLEIPEEDMEGETTGKAEALPSGRDQIKALSWGGGQGLRWNQETQLKIGRS